MSMPTVHAAIQIDRLTVHSINGIDEIDLDATRIHDGGTLIHDRDFASFDESEAVGTGKRSAAGIQSTPTPTIWSLQPRPAPTTRPPDPYDFLSRDTTFAATDCHIPNTVSFERESGPEILTESEQ